MDRRLVFWFYATAGIGALMPLTASIILKLLIDHLQIAQETLQPTIPVVLAVILAARYLVTFLEDLIYYGINQSYLDYIFRYKLQNEITLKYHEKIAKLDIGHFEDPAVQDLIEKTRSTMQWRLPDYLRIFSYVFRSAIAFLAAFIVLLPFGWWIPLVVSVITMPRLFLEARYGAIQWSIWGSGAPQAKKLWYLDRLMQEPTAVREIRITQSADALLAKFKSIQDYLFGLSKKALDKNLVATSIPPVVEIAGLFFIGYLFLEPVTTSAMTIGTFTLLITMLEQLGSKAANASSKLGQLYEDNLYLNHYFELLSLPDLIPEVEAPVVFDTIAPPRIEFLNVCFHYPNGPRVLDNISFVIEPGESVALVGYNGAGKSTIVKLLCRFYDVTSGGIYINGIDVRQLKLTHWYQFLGTLFQEFVRYHFSVRENIMFGAPDRNDERAMFEAAEKSGAATFIEKMDMQYEQVLGREFEEGEELSGGQWQKLAIARAFYEAPPVLILDEPTSAIDAEAEYEIFSNLEKHYKDKTLILVSHRFSTVRNADKIIVIEEGRKIEEGTHQALMELDGRYASLFLTQAEGYR